MNTTVNQENRDLALTFLAQIKDKKKILEAGKGVRVKLQDSEEYLTIPQEAFSMLVEFISEMAEGQKQEKFVALEAAAKILLIEKKAVIELIEEGELSQKILNGKPKILIKDVEKYKAERLKGRLAMLAKMVQEDQEMGLY